MRWPGHEGLLQSGKEYKGLISIPAKLSDHVNLVETFTQIIKAQLRQGEQSTVVRQLHRVTWCSSWRNGKTKKASQSVGLSVGVRGLEPRTLPHLNAGGTNQLILWY